MPPQSRVRPADDLPHPRADLVVAVLGLREVEEEAVHALHLVLDELHIAADAAQQLRLAHQHGGQPPKQRVQGTLGIHGSIDTPRPSACSWALTHRYNFCSIYRNSLLLFLVWKDD